MGASRTELSRFDLNLLVVLDALLTECHVTRAGERLHLSQSATSAALGRLRRVFDDPLLVAHGRRLELTPLGRSLVDPVREVLQSVEAMIGERVVSDAALWRRRFAVQCSEYVSLVLMRPLLVLLAERAPGISLRFQPLDDSLDDRLRRDEVDLVVAARHMAVSHRLAQLPHVTLFSDELVVVAWRGHPALGDELTVDDLRTHPHLEHVVAGDPGGSLVSQELAVHDVALPVQASTPSYAAMPFLVRGTSLLAFMPRLQAEQFAEPAELRILTPPLPMGPLTEVLYWNPAHDHGDAAHVWLRDRLIDLAAALPQPPADGTGRSEDAATRDRRSTG